MAALHCQSGTTRPQRNFTVDIRRIADRQPLPEYRIDIRSDGRQELAILSRDPVKPNGRGAALSRSYCPGHARKRAPVGL